MEYDEFATICVYITNGQLIIFIMMLMEQTQRYKLLIDNYLLSMAYGFIFFAAGTFVFETIFKFILVLQSMLVIIIVTKFVGSQSNNPNNSSVGSSLDFIFTNSS